MKIRFLSVAMTEVNDAIAYYEEVEPGLGLRFLAEIKSCIERVRNHPNAWAPLSKRTRRCRSKSFPVSIIYQTRDTEILIIAVMHMSREPTYWKDRI